MCERVIKKERLSVCVEIPVVFFGKPLVLSNFPHLLDYKKKTLGQKEYLQS